MVRQACLADCFARSASKRAHRRAGEELIAIDEVEQRHRLAPQGADDMPIVDDMTVLAAQVGPAARQGHERRGAEEAIEPVVVEAHAQPMADQARGTE